MDERFKRSEFAIRLSSADDLFEPFDARPISDRPLNYEARMALLDEWELARDDAPKWLTLYLPETEREHTDQAAVRAAINSDLTLASGSLRDVDPLTRSDQIAAWIGIVLLFVCIMASTAIDRATDELFIQGISQGILLLGWVALWDPAARLVTEILPHFFNRRRFREFADIDVRFSWG
jgi:hypothetical protein